jgi:hypothetical protein
MPYFRWPGAAAERHVAAAGDRVATDVLFGFDDNDRRASFPCDDRRGQPGRPGTDHHHVGFSVPRGRDGNGLHRRELVLPAANVVGCAVLMTCTPTVRLIVALDEILQ